MHSMIAKNDFTAFLSRLPMELPLDRWTAGVCLQTRPPAVYRLFC